MPRVIPKSSAAAFAGAASSGAGTNSASSPPATRTLHIAVQGCCHGELDKIYAECQRHEENWGKKIDFLICCGDFQSIRCEGDLDSMAVPVKYRTMGDFHHYCCDGEASSASHQQQQGVTLNTTKKVAPYLTIFIGGNHEASNVLFQNYYGGYIAPNVYYVGHSGVIDVKGLRLAGLSGIWKGRDATAPYPRPPYNDSTVRSAYHVRQYEVDKLHLFNSVCQQQRKLREEAAVLGTNSTTTTAAAGADNVQQQPAALVASVADARPVDIVLSHDWPVGVTKYGDEAQLLRYKPYFGPDIEKGELGNPLTMALLTSMRPRYWCSAHLHCFFSASISHTATQRTQFIALDKCTKDKSFLDFVDIVVPAEADDAAGGEGSSGADANGIRIPALWQEVLRVAQPSLDDSYKRRELSLTTATGAAITAADVALRNPLPSPIPVRHGTDVGLAVVQYQRDGKRPRDEAPTSATAGVLPTTTTAAAPADNTTSTVNATAEEAVDDWLIEG